MQVGSYSNTGHSLYPNVDTENLLTTAVSIVFEYNATNDQYKATPASGDFANVESGDIIFVFEFGGRANTFHVDEVANGNQLLYLKSNLKRSGTFTLAAADSDEVALVKNWFTAKSVTITPLTGTAYLEGSRITETIYLTDNSNRGIDPFAGENLEVSYTF